MLRYALHDVLFGNSSAVRSRPVAEILTFALRP